MMKYYVGNCVNSFDDDGECLLSNLYSDVSDFACAEEEYKEIHHDAFRDAVDSVTMLTDTDTHTYYNDEENDILVAYNEDKDIHYFFN